MGNPFSPCVIAGFQYTFLYLYIHTFIYFYISTFVYIHLYIYNFL